MKRFPMKAVSRCIVTIVFLLVAIGMLFLHRLYHRTGSILNKSSPNLVVAVSHLSSKEGGQSQSVSHSFPSQITAGSGTSIPSDHHENKDVKKELDQEKFNLVAAMTTGHDDGVPLSDQQQTSFSIRLPAIYLSSSQRRITLLSQMKRQPPDIIQRKNRAPSSPLLTGDGFRSLCSRIYDETTKDIFEKNHTFSLEYWTSLFSKTTDDDVDVLQHALTVTDVVEEGKKEKDGKGGGEKSSDLVPRTVFVQTHLLNDFIEKVQRPILDPLLLGSSQGASSIGAAASYHPYVLITHNSDYSAPWESHNVRGKVGASARSDAYKLQRDTFLQDEEEEGGKKKNGEVKKKEQRRKRRIISWYAQNVIITHPKLKPLPIGIENRYNKYGAHADLYFEMASFADIPFSAGREVEGKENKKEEKEKEIGNNNGQQQHHHDDVESLLSHLPAFTDREKLLLVSFSLKTNPKERGSALKAIQSNFGPLNGSHVTYLMREGGKKLSSSDQKVGSARRITRRDALRRYLQEVRKHRFVLTPHGHGLDTHRVWEALYMGCVPIVLNLTHMDRAFAEILPVLIVPNYDVVTEDFLLTQSEKIEEKWKGKELMPLVLSYWKKRWVADILMKEK